MDKIWDRNPLKSDVIGRCGGDEKTNDHAEPTKNVQPTAPHRPMTCSIQYNCNILTHNLILQTRDTRNLTYKR